MEIQGRVYSPGDEDQIVKLLDLIFDGWPKFDLDCSPVDYWRWKFLDHPMKKMAIGLAVVGDEIIGCNHCIYLNIKIGENTYLSHQGVDFGIHPNFRRMGASKKIGEVLDVQSQFCYVITGNEILINNYIRNGNPRFPLQIRELSRIKDMKEQQKYANVSGAIATGSYILHKLRSLKWKSTLKIRDDIEIIQVQNFDERINLFFDKVKEHFRFIAERNMDFLNWRYCDTRGGKYRITMAVEDKNILGYCVMRLNKYVEEDPRGYIVDILTLQDRNDIVEALINNAITYFDEAGVNRVFCWVIIGHPHSDIYRSYGFRETRRKLDVFYFPDRERTDYGDDLDRFANASPREVQFQFGDTDLI